MSQPSNKRSAGLRLGEPPLDYPGAVYDPEWWAEVGLLPPVEPFVHFYVLDDYQGGTIRRYSCGAQVWVYYADEDRWHLDSTSTGATDLADATRRAHTAIPEMAAHRADVHDQNRTIVDA